MIITALLIGWSTLMFSACDSESASAGDPSEPAPAVTSGAEIPLGGSIAGTIVTTMDASNYTYMEVDTGDGRVWAAGPRTPVEAGQGVELTGASLMRDFESKTLGRSFEQIYFVGSIQITSRPKGSGTSPPSSHAGANGAQQPTAGTPEPEVAGVVRAENGLTIAEVFQGSAELSGSEVSVRGVVVKVNTRILGRNWIHLKDGSVGPNGETKLIVTSEETAEIGNTVLVRGTLATDRDLGHGYFYEALVEDASVLVE